MHFRKNRTLQNKTMLHRLWIRSYFCFFELLFLSSKPPTTTTTTPQRMGRILIISIAGRKGLCVSGKRWFYDQKTVTLTQCSIGIFAIVRMSVRPVVFLPCSLHVRSTFLNPVTVFDLPIKIYINDDKRRAATSECMSCSFCNSPRRSHCGPPGSQRREPPKAKIKTS